MGCSTTPLTATPQKCDDYPIISQAQPDCLHVNDGILIQTPLNQQVQLKLDTTEITIQGTTIIQKDSETQKVIALEGTIIIGANQQITSIRAGQQAILAGEALPEIQPYALVEVSSLPLDQLKRKIDLIQPPPTLAITDTPESDCPAPDGWSDTYLVQAGESLTTIANKANVTIEDLQQGNCIKNPNTLQIGQVLHVPAGSIAPTQPSVTFTPSVVFFRADSVSIVNGDCTTLRWDVQNIRQLQLDRELITDTIERRVCPTTTTTYTLTVEYHDNTKSEHTVIIEVVAS